MKPYLSILGCIVIISSLSYACIPVVGYQALGSVFLLFILVVSGFTTRGPILFAACVCTFIWNYFFIPPQFTMFIHSWEDLMMVLSFFVAACVGGLLTSRIRRQESILQTREASETLHQTLLNSVSHELRTPLTALIGTATALKDEATVKDAKARAVLTDDLVSSAQRLNRVVENLLDLSRLQKGTLQIKREWFELKDIYDWVKVDTRAELNGRQLCLSQSGESIFVEADFQLLSHAFGQLVLNAIKYSPENSNITVQFVKTETHAKLLVCDEGQGIPVGMEDQIFEKFYRLPGTPSGGLGLGLAIVQNIIKLHKGHVSVRGREDKQGSIFEIKIPWSMPPTKLQEAIL